MEVTMRANRISMLLMATLLTLTVACGEDGGEVGGPDAVPDISGNWSGSMRFGSAFSAAMTIVQEGRTLSGDFYASGFTPLAIQGEVNSAGRMTWSASNDCQEFSGTLDLAGDTEMSGNLSYSDCDRGGVSQGTLSLERNVS
jgi:hypothetical protein